MTDGYLDAVRTGLDRLPDADRRRALAALSAQLDELADAGLDPRIALGDPSGYATALLDALGDDQPGDAARWRLLGMPVETRGPVNAEVRSRTWDPANPDLLVPRLFGIGWTLNLGAVAVRAGLIRPDDTDDDVLARIPERDLRQVQAVPLVVAGAAAAAAALAWRDLPPTVASGFGIGGRARGRAPRWLLLLVVGLGAVPAVWAQRRDIPTQERLNRVASATSLAVISASAVAATIAEAHRPQGRWGLLAAAALPVAAGSALSVSVVPLRAGLRRAWRAASVSTADPAR